ncbi:MAG: AbiV family abortive infection protein [Thaumarchaeota archaeon]|nr:AbiV family abortive infection protein [Nitrososphaerota archaeon]
MSKSNKNKIIIKHKFLDNVLEDIHNHIANLLLRSQKDLTNEDYSFCVISTILALEEIGKYEIFAKYQRELKDVPLREMEKLTKHEYKLTIALDMELEREVKILKNKTPKEIKEVIKTVEYHKVQLRVLNIVKQLAMYYNFDKGHTITLEKHFMKNEITKNNLGHFCLVLLELVYNNFNMAVLRKQCGNIDGIIDKNSQLVKQNKNFEHVTEYAKRINTKKHKVSLHKFQSTLLELEKLVSYLKSG